MRKTMMDRVISKVSRGKINTIRVSREEMVDMIDKCFIQKAEASEDYQKIWKVIKRGIIFDKILDSKDGNYQLRTKSRQGGTSFRRYVWLYNQAENTFYEYNYYVGFYGKFKRIIRDKLTQAQK